MRMRSWESCPVHPLLRLSLVGSQPMETLLGELESPVAAHAYSSRGTCPVLPLLSLSLVGSQPMEHTVAK
jgi:hypothetical protein